jgi:hypothetical protein
MMPIWLDILVVVGFLVVLFPYVVGPIIVLATLHFRMPPNVVAVDPREHPLPAQARSYFSEAYQHLTAAGFDYVATILLPDMLPNVKTLFAIYANRASCDMAMSAIIVAEDAMGGQLKTNYVEFVRRYDDDVVVQTNNSSELSAFKPMPNEFTTKFWEIRDIGRLYQLHLMLADHFRQRGQPVNQLDTKYAGNALRYVAHAVLEDTFRDQVGTGYLAQQPNGFRPTFKGACIMAWKELWPAKNIRRWREKRRAEGLLAEVEEEAKW